MEKKRIILIDDNADFRFTMGLFLERNGFAVTTADNGKAGWEKIQQEKPDLVLLDVMMETLFSGFEVCREMKNRPDTKNIPIIGVSAMKDELGVRFEEGKDQAYFSPDLFLEKPVDKDQLLRSIRNLLKLN